MRTRRLRKGDEMQMARGMRTLYPDLSENKELEMFAFMQIFHPDRGEHANRQFARETSNKNPRGTKPTRKELNHGE